MTAYVSCLDMKSARELVQTSGGTAVASSRALVPRHQGKLCCGTEPQPPRSAHLCRSKTSSGQSLLAGFVVQNKVCLAERRQNCVLTSGVCPGRDSPKNLGLEARCSPIRIREWMLAILFECTVRNGSHRCASERDRSVVIVADSSHPFMLRAIRVHGCAWVCRWLNVL